MRAMRDVMEELLLCETKFSYSFFVCSILSHCAHELILGKKKKMGGENNKNIEMPVVIVVEVCRSI
jgi:hypothetical protein